MSPPILDYPQHTDYFILTTDASDVGLGAVLSTSRQTVIEFVSRALTSAEKNYTTSERVLGYRLGYTQVSPLPCRHHLHLRDRPQTTRMVGIPQVESCSLSTPREMVP